LAEGFREEIEKQANGTLCTSEGGNAIRSELAREIIQVLGLVLVCLGVVWGLLLCCLRSRIQLAIAVSQVAAQFVAQTPEILCVPLAQLVVGIVWITFWIGAASFMLSDVPSDYVPTTSFRTQLEAAGNGTQPGVCNGQWPQGFAWQEQVDCQQNSSPGGLSCWRCAPPRYMMDCWFAYSFFSFLWHNALLIAFGQCIIAGAVGVWFFAPKSDKGKVFKVTVSFKRASFHLGSLAFGSLILALVQFVKWIMYYLSKQAKAHKNKVAEVVFACLGCVLGCFDRCVKFLNKNAYIQVALQGTGFCTSAKELFFLMARNFVRFGTLAMLGAVTHRVGVCFIVLATSVLGYLTLEAMYPDVSPILPVALYGASAYVISRLLMNVFSLAVDTTLYSFIITEEMKHRADFIPENLKSFIKQRDLEGELSHSSCFTRAVVGSLPLHLITLLFGNLMCSPSASICMCMGMASD